MDRESRATGTLLGLACGDALGRPVEFESAAAIEREYGRLTEMVGQGTWNKPAGTVTDDTDQALCIARSLVARDGWDPADVADRFVDWYESGPFDIGMMTRDALERLREGEAWDRAGQAVWENRAEGANAGNGSVMRAAPIGVAFAGESERRQAASRESSVITHADPRCVAGCVVLTGTIARLLQGVDEPLTTALAAADPPAELQTALEPVAAGETPPSLDPTGYVVDTFQVALHDALTADSLEDAVVTTVNRGGDADTVGAVTGAVAGARFGAAEIPDRWVTSIDESDELEQLGGALLDMAD